MGILLSHSSSKDIKVKLGSNYDSYSRKISRFNSFLGEEVKKKPEWKIREEMLFNAKKGW